MAYTLKGGRFVKPEAEGYTAAEHEQPPAPQQPDTQQPDVMPPEAQPPKKPPGRPPKAQS